LLRLSAGPRGLYRDRKHGHKRRANRSNGL